MPKFEHKGSLPVNLGGGHFLLPGQHVDLTTEQAATIPGLEPVLEREPPKPALEHVRGSTSLERDRRPANLTEDL